VVAGRKEGIRAPSRLLSAPPKSQNPCDGRRMQCVRVRAARAGSGSVVGVQGSVVRQGA